MSEPDRGFKMDDVNAILAVPLRLGGPGRAVLALIREKHELDSNALAVRLAIRNLALRLENPATLADNPQIRKP